MNQLTPGDKRSLGRRACYDVQLDYVTRERPRFEVIDGGPPGPPRWSRRRRRRARPGAPLTELAELDLAALAANDDMVLVPILIRRNSAVTAVTYGGQAPTGSQEALNDLATDIRVYWFYWLAADLPAAGSNVSVAVTFTGSSRGFAAAIALKGAAQTAPAFQTNTATGTSVATAALTCAGGTFVGSAIFINASNEITPGGGSGGWTAVVDAAETLNTDWAFIGYLLDQSGSVTPSASWTGSTDAAINAIRVNPA